MGRIKGRKPVSEEAQRALDEALKHSHYTFPTLSIRQAHVLLECIRLGMADVLIVQGEYVSTDEWIELIKTLINVRK
jgi:hypothetical protein